MIFIMAIVGVVLLILGSYLLHWQGQKTKGVTGGEWEAFHMADGKGHRYVTGSYLGWLFITFGGFSTILAILWPLF